MARIDDDLDELAGAEAFGPRRPGDPDDPFPRYAGTTARPAGGSRDARLGLGLAALVLLTGILAVLFGIPDDGSDDDGGGDDVAAVDLDQTTTSTSRPASSTTTSTTTTSGGSSTSSTATTSGFAPGTVPPGGATTTTVRRTTVTTVRSSTTLPQASTTTELVNRPMTIAVQLDQDPVVDVQVTITITSSDPDAEPTGHCQVVEIDGERIFDDPCAEEDCPADAPAVEDNGGTRTFRFNYTFTEAGTHEIEVSARSGRPECHNPYASTATVTETVSVAVAD